MDTKQIPDLISAHIYADSYAEVLKFKDHKVPRGFGAKFEIRDKRAGHIWQCVFVINFGTQGTPILRSVSIYGSLDLNDPIIKEYSKVNRLLNDLDPDSIISQIQLADTGNPEYQVFPNPKNVERWQIKYVEMYRFQLMELAVELAITKIHRIDEQAEDSNDVWWEEKQLTFSAIELKKIQKNIQKSIRQKITPEFLKEVADLYLSAAKRGEKPVKAIQERYKCSYRTASDYGTKAREIGFLPLTTPGRISVSTSTKPRKKGQK